jgi:uridine kinase
MLNHPNVIIIGIGGCSRSGKTILTKEMINQLNDVLEPDSEYTNIYSSIHQDRYFNRDKIRKNYIKTNKGNFYKNWEFPGALDWDIFYFDIQNEIKGINSKIKNSKTPNKKGILFIEGFLLFSPNMSNSNDKDIYLNLFDYYIYINLDKSIAKQRRMKTKTVPDDYYECILWPEHIKYCSQYVELFKNLNDIQKKIIIFDGNKQYNPKDMALRLLKWINYFKRNDLVDGCIYDNLFIPFDKQLDLLKKHFLE